jgi:hypothetical protein
MGMDEPEILPPDIRRVAFKSKKQIKKEWAKLDLPDLDKSQEPTEEHSALEEIYQDDIHGLGNE